MSHDRYRFLWTAIANLCLFFYFLTFEKADCSIFALLVSQLVGWLVDVTINSFNIYRHKSPLLTQYHSIPISTNQYQVILTQYHLVTTSITPYWPSTIKYQPVLPCKGPVLSYIMMSIATVSIDHNSNKRFALFTWSSKETLFLCLPSVTFKGYSIYKAAILWGCFFQLLEYKGLFWEDTINRQEMVPGTYHQRGNKYKIIQ